MLKYQSVGLAQPGQLEGVLISRKTTYEELEQRVRELEQETVIRRQTEEALSESKARYRCLKANVPGLVYLFALHPDGSFSFPYVGSSSCELFNIEPDDLMRDSTLLSNLIHPDDSERFYESVKQSSETLQPWREELRFKVNGDVRWYDCMSRPELRPNGDIVWDGIMLEITNRKRTEQMLRESEKKYRSLVENAPNLICLLDCNGKIQFVNRTMSDLLPKKMIGRQSHEYADPQYQGLMKKKIEHVFQTGIAESYGIKGIGLDGTHAWYDVQTAPIKRNGEIIAAANILTDITERVQDKEDLQYRLVVEKLISDISTWFINLNIKEIDQAINDVLENISRFAGADGGYVFLFSEDMNRCRMIHNWKTNKIKSNINDLQELDVSSMPWWMEKIKNNEPVIVTSVNDLPAEASAEKGILKPQKIQSLVDMPLVFQEKVIGFLGLSCAEEKRDWTSDELSLLKMVGQIITSALQRKKDEAENRELERRMQQAQKMEAIGTLAGGIAHDFNNILSAALGFTELAEIDAEKGTRTFTCLQQVKVALDRATDLVKQILTFSRQSENEPKPALLQPVIKEALKLLRGSLPATIEIRQDVDAKCGPVLADPTKIHQIVMNLATNAYHAMREQGGILDVRLESVEVGKETAPENIDVGPGHYLRLIVADNGSGMDAETREHIFEPYFTTKETGEGTGLGLATVHGIVKDHDGVIQLHSESGKGSSFSVYFPLCVLAEERSDKTESYGVIQGSERILFVDDEEQIILFAKTSLEDLGYTVHTRINSREALEAFRADPYRFDVVITDQTMPNMTGGELAKAMLELRPDLPIILCSGFSEILSKKSASELGIREFISKPILTRDLAGAIRRAID